MFPAPVSFPYCRASEDDGRAGQSGAHEGAVCPLPPPLCLWPVALWLCTTSTGENRSAPPVCQADGAGGVAAGPRREGEEGVRERVSARRLTKSAACISPGSALCLLPPRYTSARPSKRLWLLPLLPVGFALFPPKRREAATGQAAQAVYDCSY